MAKRNVNIIDTGRAAMKISSDRKFGIEIECKGLSMEAAVQAIRNVGIACRLEDYNHQTRPNWKVTTDSSVLGGFEIVSPILMGQDGLDQIQKVSDALIAAGAKVERDCGFHVHVDARDLNGLTLANILTRYAKYETAIDAIMPKSRRENNNQYCLSVVDVAAEIQDNLTINDSPAQVANRIDDRYYKLNLTAFVRHGTVEFRQHSGTVEARKMIPWVIFCVNFVETSKVTVVEKEETPGSDPTTKLRKNAIEKKYAKLAKILDAADINYVSVARIAEAMGIKETAVANYISAFRKKYQVKIVHRRGWGYRKDWGSSQSFQAAMGITPPTKKNRAVIPDDTGLFTGLDQNIVSYFQERAHDLAA